jgi:DNA polymerase-1
MNQNVTFARENGYICTGFNRRRVIPEIQSTNYMIRSFGERAAMNMPLQGTAADIIKIAMINVHNALKTKIPSAKLILQVHDELIIDAPASEMDKVVEIMKYEMENAVKLSVPLTVNVSTGKSWFEAK